MLVVRSRKATSAVSCRPGHKEKLRDDREDGKETSCVSSLWERPPFAVPSLEALDNSDHEVVGVVTQPDRPKGRGQAVVPCPVKELALAKGLPVSQPEKIKSPEFLEQLSDWKPDVIAVTAFGRILPKAILDLPPMGCVNVHGSLLPAYRGAAPIQWALIHGDAETGITTMLMDEGMDTGAVLLQQTISIEPEETSLELGARLAKVGGALLVETLTRLAEQFGRPSRAGSYPSDVGPIAEKRRRRDRLDAIGHGDCQQDSRAFSRGPDPTPFIGSIA